MNYLLGIYLLVLALILPGREAFSSAEEVSPYKTYRGVAHVHSNFSHDSNATLPLILEKTQELDFDFVMITDHNNMAAVAAYQKLKAPARPLFIFGDEVSTGGGHMIAWGIREHPPKDKSPQELIDLVRAQGGFVFLAHPFSVKEPWEDLNLEGWDGFELYDFGHELMADSNVIDFAFRSISEDSKTLLESAQKVSPKSLTFWDDVTQKRNVAMIAGADAHLERYQKYFVMALQSVSLYVLARELEEKEILEAVRTGRSFMAFDTERRASEFSFWAEAGAERFEMGETLDKLSSVIFHVRLPVPASVRLVRNGKMIKEETTQDFTFESNEPGVYRVEVFLDEKPWIYSNPIYLRF